MVMRFMLPVAADIATLVLAARAARWARRVRTGRAPAPPAASGELDDAQLLVIVPVLQETARLPGLVNHFRRLRDDGDIHRLILVSTSRDCSRFGSGSTPAACDGAAAEHDWVTHIHADDPGGSMASQINAAVLDPELIGEDELVALYNADSRPDRASLRDARMLLRGAEGTTVVQQHGLYVRNLADIASRRGVAGPVLLAAAAWQTRWSMGFERHHARMNASGLYGPLRGFSYVIGHGLFIPAGLLRRLGGMTERFANEDAHLSLALAMRGVRIVPHPRWEIADSPDSIQSLITQKRVWFGGPAHAFTYRRDIMPSAGGPTEAARLGRSTLALFNHAVCWLGGPLASVGLIVAALVARRPVRALGLTAALTAYLAVPNHVALSAATVRANTTLQRGWAVRAACGAVPMYVLHGVSAIAGSVHVMREIAAGRRLAKPKTRMRHALEDAAERNRRW